MLLEAKLGVGVDVLADFPDPVGNTGRSCRNLFGKRPVLSFC